MNTPFIVVRCAAAAILFFATAKHPYSFYILTRWIVFITCAWGLINCRSRWWPSVAPVYAGIGIIFNPLVPFHFARGTWHNLDVAAAILLMATIAMDQNWLKTGRKDGV